MKKSSFWLFCFCLVSFRSVAQLNEVLNLDDCERLVVSRSNDLKRSTLEIRKSDLYQQQAQSAIFPNLNLNLSPNLNIGRSIDPYTNQFVDRNVLASNVGLSSNITVFNGFQQKNAIKQANANQEIAELSYKVLKNKLISDVYQAYLRVLLAKEYVKMGEKQLKLLNEQIETIKVQIGAGVLTDLDLLNIETQLNLDEINLLNNKNNLHTALIGLKQLLNLPNFSKIDVQGITFERDNGGQPVENKQDILSSFILKSPNLKIANLKYKIANRNIEQLKFLRYPSVGLSMGLNSTYSNAAPKEIFISDGGEPLTLYQQGDKYVQVNGKKEKIYEPIKIPMGSYEPFAFFQQLRLNKYFFVGFNVRFSIYIGSQFKYKQSLAEIEKNALELENKNLLTQLQYNVEQMIESGYLLKKKRPILTQKQKAMNITFSAISERFKMGYATSNDYINAKNAVERVEAELIQNQLELFFNEKMVDLLK
jgi:outer membrane protein